MGFLEPSWDSLEQQEERGGLESPPIIADAPLQCLFEQEVFLFNSWEQSLKSERHGLNAISTCPTDMDSLALHLRSPSLSWR